MECKRTRNRSGLPASEGVKEIDSPAPLAIALQGIGRELPVLHGRFQNCCTIYRWVFAVSTVASLAGTSYAGIGRTGSLLRCTSLAFSPTYCSMPRQWATRPITHPPILPYRSPPGHSLITGSAYEGGVMALLLCSAVAIWRFLQKSLSNPVEYPDALLTAAGRKGCRFPL
ncbi:hypothetical protein BDZ88DRAFT_316483 [Geranomyces variabilis]|nr:hypothetical protein BDZ88DRAFT_316483 [Geranomyces variabilis]